MSWTETAWNSGNVTSAIATFHNTILLVVFRQIGSDGGFYSAPKYVGSRAFYVHSRNTKNRKYSTYDHYS